MTGADAEAAAEAVIVETVRRHHPDVRAAHLFGGFGTERQWPGGDVDTALLPPPLKAWEVGHLALTDLPASWKTGRENESTSSTSGGSTPLSKKRSFWPTGVSTPATATQRRGSKWW
ncbi:MAG: hypothetical protein ACLFRG_03320 [Desulfococcaceae bacterium]